MNRVYCILLAIFILLFACSTTEDEKDAPIIISSIDVNEATNRSPRSSDFQVDFELKTTMSEKNLRQDISYNWYVEYIGMDISITESTMKDVSSDSKNITNSHSNYFIEVSDNPLNAFLSVYKEGYYKITLIATNLIETKQKTIIIKAGEPKFPTLQLRFNLPPMDLSSDLFMGSFFLRYNNTGKKFVNEKITKIDAKDINCAWYDTNIQINPFKSFIIETGTHVLANNKMHFLSSLCKNSLPNGSDGIYYDAMNKTSSSIYISPVIMKNIDGNFVFKIYRKGNYTWESGNIYISNLSWGYNDENDSEFVYSIDEINKKNTAVSTFFNNKFLAKIFIGSIGHKVLNNDYFVFFSTDGLDTDELDSKKKREFSSLPYGYLIGRLGNNGNLFPIGTNYSYSSSAAIPIYEKDNAGQYRQINASEPEFISTEVK